MRTHYRLTLMGSYHELADLHRRSLLNLQQPCVFMQPPGRDLRRVFATEHLPRFHRLKNDMVSDGYVPIPGRKVFSGPPSGRAVPVNHIVPTVGLVVSDQQSSVAFSSDTAKQSSGRYWLTPSISTRAISLFPDEMAGSLKFRDTSPPHHSERTQELNHNGMDILACISNRPTVSDHAAQRVEDSEIGCDGTGAELISGKFGVRRPVRRWA